MRFATVGRSVARCFSQIPGFEQQSGRNPALVHLVFGQNELNVIFPRSRDRRLSPARHCPKSILKLRTIPKDHWTRPLRADRWSLGGAGACWGWLHNGCRLSGAANLLHLIVALRLRPLQRVARRTVALRHCLTNDLCNLEHQANGTPLVLNLIQRASHVQSGAIDTVQKSARGPRMPDQLGGR